jgi:16S rRNA processing protein RimM
MGRVATPHGVRGAVKVQPLSAEQGALLAFGEWWLGDRDSDDWSRRRVVGSRLQSGAIVAEFEGVTTREMAAALRHLWVGVPREILPALAPDEHYQADLIGMAVVNRKGRSLGYVASFIDSGAHPIVRVIAADGFERLIPWVTAFVDRVDVAEHRIDVDWSEDY